MYLFKQNNNSRSAARAKALSVFFFLFSAVIIARLFVLQVIEHKYYSDIASNTHEIYKTLRPERGSVFFQDTRSDKEYPAAVNKIYYEIFAVPAEIKKEEVTEIVENLSEFFQYSEELKTELVLKLSKDNDPYEPIAKKIDDETMKKIQEMNLSGIHFAEQEYRFYPENNLASTVVGFTKLNDSGELDGSYGVEGYWNDILKGKEGFLSGERGARGNWIYSAGRTVEQAENGAELVLTIDRTLQFKACERLRQGMETYKAKSASLILMNPYTGAIIAMCSLPDFDPNNYADNKEMSAFNNSTIFTPYEPGSVFKPITMAIALDLELVSPGTTFTDPGVREIDGFKIHNALDKNYGVQTMTGVLENSINTGMIWVVEKIGREKFKEYVDKFGFGKKTGIGLDTEVAGDVSQLENKGKIYSAVASFGQGVTVTPLQIATAFSALANGGQIFKPYIIDEIRYANGKMEKTKSQSSDTVISTRASKLITGMLVSVIEKGHGVNAKLEHYYMAGKTGTAQIPGKGGYTEETNHTFLGFAPSENPKFVLLVKYEAPQRQWAESTVAPVFKDVAALTLDYYGVKEEK
ncbi:MAG: penicillin-binding protein 2 [Patescibacteria group bacterium]|nr:penicillin-binding protein 2 [Patescibacteria group bacterium]